MNRIFEFGAQLKTLLFPFASKANIDIILSKADADAPLAERVEWLHDLAGWLRAPIQADERASLKSRSSRIQTARIRYLLHLLERHPDWKANLSGTLYSILQEASALELFSSTGLNRESGFFSEASNRIARRLLPAPANEKDLAAIFSRIFHDPSDADWVESLPSDLFSALVALITFQDAHPTSTFRSIRKAMADALAILGPNVAALGLNHELRVRMSSADVLSSPFRALNQRLEDIQTELASPDGLARGAENEIQACRDRMRDVILHLEETGVSVGIVFKIEALSSSLTRIETLLRFLVPNPSVDAGLTSQRFLADLIRQSVAASGLRELVRANLDLLSRKVVERVGASGEKYITSNRAEYFEMLRAGAGGGIVTVGTTIIKFALSKAHLPLFFEGLFAWMNYSGSFLLMQSLHFALATKQPSMTASALANKLKLVSRRVHLKEFVDEVAQISRSQFAAALGNIGLVVPAALAFDAVIAALTGQSAIAPDYAIKVIKSLNPVNSLTIPAAALTGVLLWASSVMGGWVENWAVYRRLPEALATNRRLAEAFGPERAKHFAAAFSRQIAGVASNVSIGFLLAFTPVVGLFFGAPLDVRHVTLSSGSLAFAVSSVGWENLDKPDFALACVGILIILTLNFGVSFALALFVAIRARRVKRAWVYHLMHSVGQRLSSRTREFFFPLRDP